MIPGEERTVALAKLKLGNQRHASVSGVVTTNSGHEDALYRTVGTLLFTSEND